MRYPPFLQGCWSHQLVYPGRYVSLWGDLNWQARFSFYPALFWPSPQLSRSLHVVLPSSRHGVNEPRPILQYPLLRTAPFGQVLKKSVGNSTRENNPGQNLVNTAPSKSSLRLCRMINRCVFPWRNISAETLPSRRSLKSPLPREPMMICETFSHSDFLWIAVEISPLVIISPVPLTLNPRGSRKSLSSSSWILTFSICASCVQPCLVYWVASTTCWRPISCIPGILVRHKMVFLRVQKNLWELIPIQTSSSPSVVPLSFLLHLNYPFQVDRNVPLLLTQEINAPLPDWPIFFLSEIFVTQ